MENDVNLCNKISQSEQQAGWDIADKNNASLKGELFIINQIVDALSSGFHDVYYADISTGLMTSYRCSRTTRESFGDRFEHGSFESSFYYYVRNAVHPDDQKLFEPVLTITGVRSLFKIQTSYGFKYRSVRNGEIHYCQARIVKLKEITDGFVFAFKNIDKDHQLELDAHEKSKLKMQQGLEHFSAVIQKPMAEIDALLQEAMAEDLLPERRQELLAKAKEKNNRLRSFISRLKKIPVDSSERLEVMLKQFAVDR